ncbi:MAG: S1C family serine protease [Flavobacteriales bacterium]
MICFKAFPSNRAFLALWLILPFMFQGCVAIFKTKVQNDVKLTTKGGDKNTRITVMNKPDTGTGSLTLDLKRKNQAYQAVLQKEGYKDAYRAVYSDDWNAGTVILLTLDVLASPLIVPCFLTGGGGTYKKFCDFQDPYRMEPPQVKIPKRTDNQKYLYHGSTTFDISKDDTLIVEYQKPSDYKEGDEPESIEYSSEDLNAENLIFNSDINDLLVRLGYRDTTKEDQGLSLNNYNSVKLNSTIERFHVRMFKKQQSYFTINMSVNWKLTDNFGDKLYDTTITTESGQFARDVTAFDFYDSESSSREESLENVQEASLKRFKLATLDALEASLVKLVKNRKVESLMKKGEAKKEQKALAEKKTISIPKPDLPEKGAMNEQVKGVVTIKKPEEEGHGSGCVISKDGYVLTNYHVVAGLDSARILFGNGNEGGARIKRKSKVLDLALLKMDTTGLNPLVVKEDSSFDIGSEVMAIGTPKNVNLGQTVTKGIVSGKRTLNEVDYIQTDVSINAGNSGGALIEKSSGKLLGIVTAKMFGIGVEGIGFAVPAHQAFKKLKVRYD